MGFQQQAGQDADGQALGGEPVLTARILEQYLAAARTGTWSRGADADLLAAGRSLAAVLLRRREFVDGARRRQPRASAAGPPVPGNGDQLIPLTVGEVRRLFSLCATAAHPAGYHERWSRWRRRHQARAQQSHCQRRNQLHHALRLSY